MSFEAKKTFTVADFIEVSGEIWDDEIYGRNAFSIVKYFKSTIQDQQGEIPLNAQKRIGQFAQKMGFIDYSLHGSIGKSFDVIAVLCNLKDKEAIGLSHAQGQFVTYDVLLEDLGSSPFTKSQQQNTIEMLRNAARKQIRTSQAYPQGEIIFEGALCMGTSWHMTFEEIATSSLAGAFADGRRNPEIAEYLRDIYGPVQP